MVPWFQGLLGPDPSHSLSLPLTAILLLPRVAFGRFRRTEVKTSRLTLRCSCAPREPGGCLAGARSAMHGGRGCAGGPKSEGEESGPGKVVRLREAPGSFGWLISHSRDLLP